MTPGRGDAPRRYHRAPARSLRAAGQLRLRLRDPDYEAYQAERRRLEALGKIVRRDRLS